MENIDKKVMNIFDREFQSIRSSIFDNVDNLFQDNDMEITPEDLNPYYLFYYNLLSSQLKNAGYTPVDIVIPSSNGNVINWKN